MRTVVRFLAVISLALGSIGTAQARARVDIGFFYDSLAPYGQWMVHARFGDVWRPTGVEAGWRPYTHGHWRDRGGDRMWVSEYPWGWAPFHYGRWFPDPELGWVWVPGSQWAPAWVAWRNGGGYVGWAPLQPEADFDDEDGYAGDYGASVEVAPEYWSFVGAAQFGNLYLGAALLPAYRNYGLVQNTYNITHYTVVNHRWENHSFDRDWLERRGWEHRPRERGPEHGGRGDGNWREDREHFADHRGEDHGRRNIQPVMTEPGWRNDRQPEQRPEHRPEQQQRPEWSQGAPWQNHGRDALPQRPPPGQWQAREPAEQHWQRPQPAREPAPAFRNPRPEPVHIRQPAPDRYQPPEPRRWQPPAQESHRGQPPAAPAFQPARGGNMPAGAAERPRTEPPHRQIPEARHHDRRDER